MGGEIGRQLHEFHPHFPISLCRLVPQTGKWELAAPRTLVSATFWHCGGSCPLQKVCKQHTNLWHAGAPAFIILPSRAALRFAIGWERSRVDGWVPSPSQSLAPEGPDSACLVPRTLTRQRSSTRGAGREELLTWPAGEGGALWTAACWWLQGLYWEVQHSCVVKAAFLPHSPLLVYLGDRAGR